MTSSALKQLLPSNLCQLCRAPTSQPFLCEACKKELPRLPPEQCHRCALPLSTAANLCPECLSQPPAFTTTSACFCYEPPVSRWIHNFKYNGNLGDARLLLDELLQRIKHNHVPFPDLLVPIPMPKSRQLRRGFNQTQWLAKQLSKRLSIPVCMVLKATTETTTQAGNNRRNRLHNKHNSFALHSRNAHKCKGRHIALIDDVMTTGATLRAASKILKDSGACRVDLWIIARTAKEHGK